MLDMKAEMEDEVFHAETVDVEIHPSTSLAPHPDRSHWFELEVWWIRQRPVWFHKKAMGRMNEFERIGKVLVKTRTLLMLLIAKPLEDALDGREILTMNEEVQVIHLPYRAVTVQLLREHRTTKRDARNALLFTGHEYRSEFRRQQEIPSRVLDQLLLEAISQGRWDEGLMAWEVNPLVEQRGDSLYERFLNDSVPNLVRESHRLLGLTNVFCQEVC
jgi:hypothetical protein